MTPAPDVQRSVPDPITVELCCANLTDVRIAAELDVPVIELNSGLTTGGLTPSVGLVKEARRIYDGEIIAMLRPREGGFCYSSDESATLRHDAEMLADLGVNGFAVGFLTKEGHIDSQASRSLREQFPALLFVFHRAIDVSPDFEEAARAIVECGYDRILTSGGQSRAVESLSVLRDLVRRVSSTKTAVVAAGGIRAGNVMDVLRETGVRHIHSAATATLADGSLGTDPFGFGISRSDVRGGHLGVSRPAAAELCDIIRQA